MLPNQVRGQPIRLARGGPIADGDQLDLVLARQLRENGDRLLPAPLRLVRVDRRGGGDLAGAADDRHLNAGAKTGIESHRRPRPRRRREQQVTQIAGEHLDRLLFGNVPEPHAKIELDVGQDLCPPGPAHRLNEPAVARPAPIGDADVPRDLSLERPRLRRCLLLRVFRSQLEVQHLLLLAPEQR